MNEKALPPGPAVIKVTRAEKREIKTAVANDDELTLLRVANDFLNRKRFEDALDAYGKVRRFVNVDSIPALIGEARSILGLAYSTPDLDKRREHFEDVRKLLKVLLKKDLDPAALGKVYLLKAEMFTGLGDFKKALECYRKATDCDGSLASGLRNDIVTLTILIKAKGNVEDIIAHIRREKSDTLKLLLTKNLEIASGFYKKKAETYIWLGDYYRSKNQYAEAEDCYRKAHTIYGTKVLIGLPELLEELKETLLDLIEKAQEMGRRAGSAPKIKKKLEDLKKEDFDALGLKQGAAEKEITKAYRKLTKEHHPDCLPKNISEEEKARHVKIFIRATEARDRLLGED